MLTDVSAPTPTTTPRQNLASPSCPATLTDEDLVRIIPRASASEYSFRGWVPFGIHPVAIVVHNITRTCQYFDLNGQRFNFEPFDHSGGRLYPVKGDRFPSGHARRR